MTNDCIFCKIVNKQIPAHVLYEDELLLALMDAFPAAPGHVLIIPKAHAQDLHDLPEATAAAILPLAQRLAHKINETLQPDGINIIQNNGAAAGQVVFHYHMHLIPRKTGDNIIIKSKPLTVKTEELAEWCTRLTLN